MGDVLILNSTTNAHKAVEYISNHTNVEAYLDNDKTGRKCLSRLQESCPGTRFWDGSGFYATNRRPGGMFSLLLTYYSLLLFNIISIL